LIRSSNRLLENVKGLLSHEGGKTVRKIYQTLDELGYDTESRIINTKDFLPQNRERIFIVATLRGKSRREIFPISKSSNKSAKRSTKKQDASLQCPGHSGGNYRGMNMVVIHQSNRQQERVYDPKGISQTISANGGGWGAKTGLYTIPVLTPDRIKKRQNGRRFKEDGDPAFTLTVQDKHGIFDGKRIRRLTPKECERLQGFDDEYTKGISNSQRYKCLGNAVSIPVVEHILSRITLSNNCEGKN
jgi:DNA (cytosine-5)-methyltransferase 1